MSINLSASDWEALQSNYLNAKSAQYGKYGSYDAQTAAYNRSVFKEDTVEISKNSSNSCTDGKDDGKIGFFSALGHTIKGAVKGVVNGIKSCFTDSEGKFSLGKTLLTVAAGAACIAFPAVGLVACGIGAAVGGTKLASGVYKAATAKTDAEAKDAWEQVGDGGLTLVTSVAGAKASLGAVKTSSTAGIQNADDILRAADKLDDGAQILDKIDDLDDVATAAKILKDAGADTSALGSLDDSASLTTKAGALLQDMKSSTVNNGTSLLNSVKKTAAVNKEVKDYNKLQAEYDKIKDIDAADLTPEQQKIFDDYMSYKYQETTLSTEAQAKINAQIAKQDAQDALKAAQESVNNAKKALKTAQKGDDEIVILDKLSQLEEAQNNLNALKANTTLGQATTALKETAGKSEVVTKVKDMLSTEKGIKGVVASIKNMKDSTSFQGAWQALSKDGQAIASFLTSTQGSYSLAVQKYGYSNVLEVLEVFAAYQLTNESI